jgi:predicted nucleic acid-binding protein
MALIVDASVAVKWFANEDRADAARKILNQRDLAAPEFVLLELFHALWNLARCNQFHLQDLEPSLHSARNAFDYFASQEVLFDEASKLARYYMHPIYDCLYIILAQRERATLITADEKQFGIARKAKVDVQLL